MKRTVLKNAITTNVSKEMYLYCARKMTLVCCQHFAGYNRGECGAALKHCGWQPGTATTLHVTPKESFYPICTKSRKKLKDDEDVYLVKISAKKEFLQEQKATTDVIFFTSNEQ
ncbi:hypothetical protein E2C01_017836 [Portunus trituberculatus]|uniref:Uncharacterized protein n=1 Tax=Portunus trituberculatus TaxID=210409 RepID=A0A5B7DUW2_PORTR|nr:hypothetical protein [Portunus trituberculatus]